MEYTFKGYLKSIETKNKNKTIVKFKFTSNVTIKKETVSIAISYVGKANTNLSKVIDNDTKFIIDNNKIFTLLASNKNEEFIITYDDTNNEIKKVEFNYD